MQSSSKEEASFANQTDIPPGTREDDLSAKLVNDFRENENANVLVGNK